MSHKPFDSREDISRRGLFPAFLGDFRNREIPRWQIRNREMSSFIDLLRVRIIQSSHG